VPGWIKTSIETALQVASKPQVADIPLQITSLFTGAVEFIDSRHEKPSTTRRLAFVGGRGIARGRGKRMLSADRAFKNVIGNDVDLVSEFAEWALREARGDRLIVAVTQKFFDSHLESQRSRHSGSHQPKSCSQQTEATWHIPFQLMDITFEPGGGYFMPIVTKHDLLT
jgi:hypothetical protein